LLASWIAIFLIPTTLVALTANNAAHIAQMDFRPKKNFDELMETGKNAGEVAFAFQRTRQATYARL
jgi:hypothetical protein